MFPQKRMCSVLEDELVVEKGTKQSKYCRIDDDDKPKAPEELARESLASLGRQLNAFVKTTPDGTHYNNTLLKNCVEAVKALDCLDPLDKLQTDGRTQIPTDREHVAYYKEKKFYFEKV